MENQNDKIKNDLKKRSYNFSKQVIIFVSSFPKTNVYWLSLLKDATRVDTAQVNQLLSESEQISKMLGASLLTLSRYSLFALSY